MNYRLNFEGEPLSNNFEFDDSHELFDEAEADLFDTEMYEEFQEERSRPRRLIIPRRRIAPRRPIMRRRPIKRRRPIARPRPRRPMIFPTAYPSTIFGPTSSAPTAEPTYSEPPVEPTDSPQIDEPSDTAQPVEPTDSAPSGEPSDDAQASEFSMGDFKPVAVESPGGGRITNKTDPKPADLETLSGVGGKKIKLHRYAAAAWRALVKAARAQGIAEPLLLIVSGYRSYARQKQLWEAAVKKYGSKEKARKWVAPPGGSAHQSGRAIDFHLGGKNSSANVSKLRQLPAYRWLATNAGRFGFYPYSNEPWHWEYNPPATNQKLEFDHETYDSFELWNEDEESDSYTEIGDLELFEEEMEEWSGEAPVKKPAQVKKPASNSMNLKRVGKGYAGYGGGRLYERVKELRDSGKLSISDSDLDMLQRIANVESGGYVQAINSWDSAFMSMGFMQLTALYSTDGKLQELIQLAPAAFKKYGIELDAPRRYTIKAGKETYTPIAIKGAQVPNDLRSLEWAQRFYKAGLDPEIIVAQVKLALEKIKQVKEALVKLVGKNLLVHYDSSPVVRALIQETYNNRPAYLRIALRSTMAAAKQMGAISTDKFLEMLRELIRKIYKEKEPQKGPQKAENLIKKTARLFL